MPSLVIVTGPPGAGKSTAARALANRFGPSVLVQGDAFFGFIERGAITPWLREANEQNEVVTQAAAAAAGQYAAGGFVTVYDGMVGPWFLSTFLGAAGLRRVDYVVLMPSLERSKAPPSPRAMPEDAAELRISLRDPDAPGGTFTHWLVTGIDPSSSDIGQGTVPVGGTEEVNSFGERAYGGPCPPPGDGPHRYVFTVEALDSAGDVLASADLTTTYGR